jgi:hypothetical protein
MHHGLLQVYRREVVEGIVHGGLSDGRVKTDSGDLFEGRNRLWAENLPVLILYRRFFYKYRTP